MEDPTRIEIDGYSFDRDMGLEAKREQKAVEVMTNKLDMNKPDTVLRAYRQITSQKLFHTQVGYDFLKGMQNYLITNPEIDNSEIYPIEIDSPEESLLAMNAAREKRGEKAKSMPQSKKNAASSGKDSGSKAKIFMATTIILGVMVVSMFIITLTAKVPTVLNYERVLLDRYSTWEQELNEREAEVNAKEAVILNSQGNNK